MADKQVTVDNWGIFLLQRLQHFFNRTDYCDLTLQFENNVQLKVHRLVVNACTEYFQMLEQSCEFVDDCLIMPNDLQPDVVLPIVNFMYTGQLQYRSSIYHKLYATAELMNMTVLTKLLDAQKNPISPLPKSNKKSPPVTWNLQGKKIVPKTMDPDLPEPLPGRKLPVWKRKNAPGQSYKPFDIKHHIGQVVPLIKPFMSNAKADNAPRPTRFELPEDENIEVAFESSFDDISYESKPIAPLIKEEIFSHEDVPQTVNMLKRCSDGSIPDPKRVNLQEMKEYLQEHRLRTDYVASDDSTSNQNEFEYYSDDNNSNSQSRNVENMFITPSKSILKSQEEGQSQSKRVRFNFEDKENSDGGKPTAKVVGSKMVTTVESSGINHAKIISEVLKKYPHLVKKNKNIKLKIMQKNTPTHPQAVQVSKAPPKISYIARPAEKRPAAESYATNVWECGSCSVAANKKVTFDTHYGYRKHLLEVHDEKVDTKVCEHCEFKSTKHNVLMYHMQIVHNIKPPAKYKFPQCNRCDYISLNDATMAKHKATEHSEGVICKECKAILLDYHDFVRHSYVENHNANMHFDCKFCPKKFLRAVNLLKHMRTHHKNEYSQIGFDDIAFEQPGGDASNSRIQILSNVKVEKPNVHLSSPESAELMAQIQNLEPSSEAEALSNVASGIAASLGLVDTIVVLDDNQFVLQSTEDMQSEHGAKQEQFIVPDLREENIAAFGAEHGLSDRPALISEANIISNDGMTSTDELVMVLTDHDYSDGTEPIITSENSNIVVLYSHPVDGQQTQYISQQGNIILNPQTGMLEMTGNQMHVTTSEPVSVQTLTSTNLACLKAEPEESIEMIQQEINNHSSSVTETHVELQQSETEMIHVAETEAEHEETLDMPNLTEAVVNDGNDSAERIDAEMPVLSSEKEDYGVNVEQAPNVEVTNCEINNLSNEEYSQNFNESLCESVENGDRSVLNESKVSETDCVDISSHPTENTISNLIEQENEHSHVDKLTETVMPEEPEQTEIAPECDEPMDVDEPTEDSVEPRGDAEESVADEDQTVPNNDELQRVDSKEERSASEVTELVEVNQKEFEQSDEQNLNKDTNDEPMDIDSQPITTTELDESKNEDIEKEVTDGVENKEQCNELHVNEAALPTEESAEQIEDNQIHQIDEKFTEIENTKVENNETANAEVENNETANTEVENNETANTEVENNETENTEVESIETGNTDAETTETENMEAKSTDVESKEIENTQAENVEVENVLQVENSEVENTEIKDAEVENELENMSTVDQLEKEKLEETDEREPENVETKTVAEEMSNDNVTALVSDWCDEDSGLLSADVEKQPEPERMKSPVIMPEKISRKSSQNKSSNPKINKLLDDWDDCDTDSQHSAVDPVQKSSNDSQIDNLIDDWDDDE